MIAIASRKVRGSHYFGKKKQNGRYLVAWYLLKNRAVAHHAKLSIPHVDPFREGPLERRELHRLCHCYLEQTGKKK